MYSSQNPLVVPTDYLPMRGEGYDKEFLNVQPFGVPEMMLLSQAVSKDEYYSFVEAVQNSIGNEVELTVADFFVIAALQRIISFQNPEMLWNWTCTDMQMRLRIAPEASDNDKQIAAEYLTTENFVFKHEEWYLHHVSRENYERISDVIVRDFSGVIAGKYEPCGTHNSVPVTPELFFRQIKQIPLDFKLEEGFAFPMARDLGEYKMLARTKPELKKLLDPATWLGDKYGETLGDKINFLMTAQRDTAMSVLQQAIAYSSKASYGIERNIHSPNCVACGAHTATRVLTITPNMFFEV